MPLSPLRFNSIKAVHASIKRLERAGLVHVKKVSNHFEVSVEEQCADQLLIAKNGETYLYSELKQISKTREAIDLVFINKKRKDIPAKKLAKISPAGLIHNYPLAMALDGLCFNKKVFSCQLPTSTDLFPFTPVFPAITEKEVTVEYTQALDINRFSTEKNRAKVYKLLIQNQALDDLAFHTHKNEKQLKDELFLYQNVICDYFDLRENRYAHDITDIPEDLLEIIPELRDMAFDERVECLGEMFHEFNARTEDPYTYYSRRDARRRILFGIDSIYILYSVLTAQPFLDSIIGLYGIKILTVYLERFMTDDKYIALSRLSDSEAARKFWYLKRPISFLTKTSEGILVKRIYQKIHEVEAKIKTNQESQRVGFFSRREPEIDLNSQGEAVNLSQQDQDQELDLTYSFYRF